MDTFRKWWNKPKADDQSLLALFYFADESLTAVASELDSFDGRAEPERCSRLVARLRQGQDQVLSITNVIMDELLADERTPRSFRAKFPEEVLQDSLAGQLWFGAECLAAGSSIMNREQESSFMRPLAKAVTKSLDNVRNLLREQCLRIKTPNAARLQLDANDPSTEQLCESLKIFDRLFAEFELLYVSAMVQVKSKQEHETQELICVLFSETLQRALRLGRLTQDQVDYFDPALMFSIPRLAIVAGLVIYPQGPLCMGGHGSSEQLSEMFRPFRTLLVKIRELLRTLSAAEFSQLEQMLCTNEEIGVATVTVAATATASTAVVASIEAPTGDDDATLQRRQQQQQQQDRRRNSANSSRNSVTGGSDQLVISKPNVINGDEPSRTTADDHDDDEDDDDDDDDDDENDDDDGNAANTSSLRAAIQAATILWEHNADDDSDDADDDRRSESASASMHASTDAPSGFFVSNTNLGQLLQPLDTALNGDLFGPADEDEDDDSDDVDDDDDDDVKHHSDTDDDDTTTSASHPTQQRPLIAAPDSGTGTADDRSPDSEVAAAASATATATTTPHWERRAGATRRNGVQCNSAASASVAANEQPTSSTATGSSHSKRVGRSTTRRTAASTSSSSSYSSSPSSSLSSLSSAASHSSASTASSATTTTTTSSSAPAVPSSASTSAQQPNGHHHLLHTLYHQRQPQRHHHHHHHHHGHSRKKRAAAKPSPPATEAASTINEDGTAAGAAAQTTTTTATTTTTTSGEDDAWLSDCSGRSASETAKRLALRSASRKKFKSTENLLHRLFVCIAGVADQLQTNFASDLRQILRSVFLMNMSVDEPEPPAAEQRPKDADGQLEFEFRASEQDVVIQRRQHTGDGGDDDGDREGSTQSIYSAAEEAAADADSSSSSASSSSSSSSSSAADSVFGAGDHHHNQHQHTTTATSAGLRRQERSASFEATAHRQAVQRQAAHQVAAAQPRTRSLGDGAGMAAAATSTHRYAAVVGHAHTAAPPVVENRLSARRTTGAQPMAVPAPATAACRGSRTNSAASSPATSHGSTGAGSPVRAPTAMGAHAAVAAVAVAAVPSAQPPRWVPDVEAPRCMACAQAFTTFRRRHHCRNCGGVFCGVCSAASLPLPKFGLIKAVRVCLECFVHEVGCA